VKQSVNMCEEARHALIGYLDALEEYDRLHVMLLAAYRAKDAEVIDGYRLLVREAKVKLGAAREQFQTHQRTHRCCEVIRLEETP